MRSHYPVAARRDAISDLTSVLGLSLGPESAASSSSSSSSFSSSGPSATFNSAQETSGAPPTAVPSDVDRPLSTGTSGTTDSPALPPSTGTLSATTTELAFPLPSSATAPPQDGGTWDTTDTNAGASPSVGWSSPTESVSPTSPLAPDQPGTTTALASVPHTVSVTDAPTSAPVWAPSFGPESTTIGASAGDAESGAAGKSAGRAVAICIAVGVALLLGVAGWRLWVLRRRRRAEAGEGADDLGDEEDLWRRQEGGVIVAHAEDGLLPPAPPRQPPLAAIGSDSASPVGSPLPNRGDHPGLFPTGNPERPIDDSAEGPSSCASSTLSYINTLCGPETASSRTLDSPMTYMTQTPTVPPPSIQDLARFRPLPVPTMPQLPPARPMYALNPEERASVWSMMDVRDSGYHGVYDGYYEGYDLRPPEYSRY